jgi:HEAT repeat protein
MIRIVAALLALAGVACTGGDPTPHAALDWCDVILSTGHDHHAGHDTFAMRHDATRARLERLDAVERAVCIREWLKDDERRELGAILLGGEIGRGTTPVAIWVSDTDPAVRSGAVLALGSRGESAHRDVLVAAIDDPAPRVRVAAITALRGLADRHGATLTAIDRRLDDPDAAVRAEAVSTLGVLGGTGHARHIELLLRDPDPEVRVRATYALRNLEVAE